MGCANCKKKKEDDDEELKKPTCGYACRKQCCPCTLSGRPRAEFDQSRCCGRLLTEGNWENEFVKSFVGFFAGILISFLWMGLLTHIVKSKPKSALVSCVFLGLFLSMGLAFSRNVRCYVLLAVPSLFSSKGRYALTVLVMVFIVSGPIKNFERNELAVSASLTCGQEMVGNITKAALKQASNPGTAILDRLKSTLKNLSKLTLRFINAIKKIASLFKQIFAAVAKFVKWLGNMVNVCNDKMGKPYKKCRGIFDKAYKKCKKKLPPIVNLICHVAKIPKFLCEIVKIVKLLCKITQTIKKAMVRVVKNKFKGKLKDLNKMFDYNVTVKYRYNMRVKSSKSMKKVATDIAKDVMKKFKIFEQLKKFGVLMTIFSMVMLVFKAWNYKRKYLSMDRFDNTYISPLLEEINWKREQANKETIFPLTFREKFKYFKITSCKLTKAERRKMFMGFFTWCFTIGTGLFWMGLDYGMYWLLQLIRSKGKLVITDPVPGEVKLKVEGNGIMADMYRAVISNMDPRGGKQMSLDTTPCLPKGTEPDYTNYKVIAILYGVILFIALTESYLLRLRHIAVGCYHPKREKSRAIYLYNHILRNRGNFFIFLLRQARRNARKREGEERISVAQRCATSDNWCMRKLCSRFVKDQKACLGCGETGKKDDLVKFVKCQNAGCDGFYCRECYADMNNICSSCQKPAEYGDLSDISEEQDSSENDDLQEFYADYFKGDVEVGYKKGRYFKKDKEEEKKKPRWGRKKKGQDADEENKNMSNYKSLSNINQSNISAEILKRTSSDGLYYDYQFVKEPKTNTEDYDRDYEYKLYRKRRKDERRKVELVTMDIFRMTDSDTDSELSDPDERPDRAEDSSPDDLDWNDSEREDDEVTYQPSYRKLNFDYVV